MARTPLLLTASLGAALVAGLLSGCSGDGGDVAPTVTPCQGSVSGDVDLTGLSDADVLLTTSGYNGTELVVYRNGTVARMNSASWAWSAADGGADAAGFDGAGADGDTGVVTVVAAATSVASNAAIRPADGPGGPGSAVVVPVLAPPQLPRSPMLVVGALPECALADLAERAASLADLVETLEGDLGEPGVTDQTTSRLEYRGDTPVSVSAYALTWEDANGISGDQVSARALMRSLPEVVSANLGATTEVWPELAEVVTREEEWGQLTGCEPVTGADAVQERAGQIDPADPLVGMRGVAPGIEACQQG